MEGKQTGDDERGEAETNEDMLNRRQKKILLGLALAVIFFPLDIATLAILMVCGLYFFRDAIRR